jgi:single-strand DNA-binding protein
MDYNKVILVGRIGRDPESKVVGESSLSSFSLATSYKPKNGKEITEWHQITAWGKLGEIAQQIIHKGDRVLVEGRISYNVVGEGEAKKTYTQITASNLINYTPKGAGVGQAGTSGPTSAQTTAVEEDIPF